VTLEGYELTEHAAIAIAERGIDIEWVARVLAHPERTEKDRSDRVVYNASVNPPRIVTSYFDRRQRGKA
jgi:hypothetical protein